MRAVVTRVSRASVTVDGEVVGQIGRGYLVLLGVAPTDDEAVCDALADKVCNLRIFEDGDGKMNLNLEQVGGSILAVSQFTLLADTRSRRPSFIGAARPEQAIPLYQRFIDNCKAKGFEVQQGVFGAHMEVASVNDGPVTILLEVQS